MKRKIFAALVMAGAFLISFPVTGRAEEITDGAVIDEGAAEAEDGYGYVPIAEDDMAPSLDDSGIQLFSATQLPATYNPISTNYGYTLPTIRNQEPYGSCWAFSALGLQELGLLKSGAGTRDLSELQLAYFTYHSVTDPLGGTSEIGRASCRERV